MWEMWATFWAKIHKCGKMWEPAQAPAANVGTIFDVVWRWKCCTNMFHIFVLAYRPEAASRRAPDLTVAQPSGVRHLDRLGVGAIWQIEVLAQWLG
jgi:hypothetical protein